MEDLKVLELFAGIGACSKALTNLGIPHTIVDAVEVDPYAVKSFNAVHGTNFEPQDIKEWDKDIDVDLIMHGSPCQDFSLAGRQAGGDKGSDTRSSLMYETLRIIERLKPQYVIWENVKNLLSKKHRHNFDAYIEAMAKLGYESKFQVLNAKDYGVPQNRERVFTISVLGENHFEFPQPIKLERRLKDVLESNVDEKYYLSDKQVKSFKADSDRQQALGRGFCFKPRGVDDYATCISTMAGQRKTDNFIVVGEAGRDFRIRKLTPLECWRLMGFDDEDFKKTEKGNSNTQLYKQAGNSIVVDVLYNIFKELLNGKDKTEGR